MDIFNMKLTNEYLNNLADQWSGAYRADYNGREVSIQIIKTLFQYGFSEADAEQVYRAKYLRWFFDSQGDRTYKTSVGKKFTEYLDKNIKDIRFMFEREMNRKCSV